MIGLVVAGIALVGLGFYPVGGGVVVSRHESSPVSGMDLSKWSDHRPQRQIQLLFLHHSCGGALLADPGETIEQVPGACIWQSHPQGGGLRKKLAEDGYKVAEASYLSLLGDDTDLFDWLPKFQRHMAAIQKCAGQDETYPDGERNEVIVFKSCFPNNLFVGSGEPEGDPAGPELTVSNAKAAFRALLGELGKHPDTLFVYLTAPPMAPKLTPRRLYRVLLDLLRGRGRAEARYAQAAEYARQFNDWLKGEEGWLRDYSGRNVVVFDYFDVLTGDGASNYSKFATEDGFDSHPNREGNVKAAERFRLFLNRSVRRSGLIDG